MEKVDNIKRTVFLTPNGWRTPKQIWQGQDSTGETFTDMTKQGLQNHIKRIEKLRLSNPELFKD